MGYKNLFLDILTDTVLDTVKLVPFLFLTYLAMEYLENKAGEKTAAMLLNAGKGGPVIGGILGVFPQCGFSAAASGLYSGGVITAGTLIAVFLSTSDEMLPILISERAPVKTIFLILGAKIVTGAAAGIAVDVGARIFRKNGRKKFRVYERCRHGHCHCKEGSMFCAAAMHCVEIAGFIFLVSFLLNIVAASVGMEELVSMVSRYPLLSIFVSGLIGLIPNCAASVTITKLYLEGILGVGCMFAGLLSCAGIGLLVLFRTNRDWRKNVLILVVLYVISVACGGLAQLFSFWNF